MYQSTLYSLLYQHSYYLKSSFLFLFFFTTLSLLSISTVWDVKDFGLKVKRGLHIYGRMTLRTEETYETTINFDKDMQLRTIIHLTPLRYGKMANTSDGKPIFEHVNLALHKDSERPELGPDLKCREQSQELTGYVS